MRIALAPALVTFPKSPSKPSWFFQQPRLRHRHTNHHGLTTQRKRPPKYSRQGPRLAADSHPFLPGIPLCPTEHPIPRMSQSAFHIGLEAMYKALTSVDLERVVYGKPELAIYKYADKAIASWMERIHNDERLPSSIYMTGDNLASNIIGGNMYGWKTCLVRTDACQGEENDDQNPASFGVLNNVLEAVQKACRKELGNEFRFEFDERINPVLHRNGISAIE